MTSSTTSVSNPTGAGPDEGIDYFVQSHILPLTMLDLRGKATTIVVASAFALQLAGLGTTSNYAPWAQYTPGALALTVSRWAELPQGDSGESGSPADGSKSQQSTATTIKQFREESGLTWDQIAKIFAVSRRAVHLWAAGKSMNAGHEELLYDLLQIVGSLPGSSPTDRRAAILSPVGEGPSLYDRLRTDRANAEVLKRSSFRYVVEEADEAN